MSVWKPTAQEVAAIKRAAAKEGNLKLGAVILEPGLRTNLEDRSKPRGMNIALVSDQPDWNDTDLSEYGYWADFRKGVPLSPGGKAIVDFYIRQRFDDYGELFGNVTVTYEGGRLASIRGYGQPRWYPVD